MELEDVVLSEAPAKAFRPAFFAGRAGARAVEGSAVVSDSVTVPAKRRSLDSGRSAALPRDDNLNLAARE